MTKHTTKSALLKEAITQHRLFESTMLSLSPEQLEMPGVTGEWSVKDLLLHLTAWEQNLVAWYKAGRSGEMPDMACVNSRQGMNDFNRRIFEQNRHHSLADALALFASSYQQTLVLVETLPEEEIFTPRHFAWTGKWLLADFISANMGNHYKWARDQIKKWINTKSMSSL